MRIAVLGTGMVGQALAARFAELGHTVSIGTRDPQATWARTEPDAFGNPPLRTWSAANPAVAIVTFGEAAAGADLLVNATAGQHSVAALSAVDRADLQGAVLLDVANLLDFSAGFPPHVAVDDTQSLAEQIAAAFPGLRVVKSLCTMTAPVMVQPQLVGGGDHSVFVSGDDPAAKQVVLDLLAELGHRDVIDLGGLSTARGQELLLPMWLRLLGALGTGMFQWKIVR
jgi:predicted dinucleotide-binding enzyme